MALARENDIKHCELLLAGDRNLISRLFLPYYKALKQKTLHNGAFCGIFKER